MEKKIDDLSIENKEINNENKDIKRMIYRLNLTNLFNKYIVAIQDLNSYKLLEDKVSDLTKLRDTRIIMCQFIKRKDTDSIKQAKINVLYKKLHEMPEEISEMFEDDYENLIDDLKKLNIYKDVTIDPVTLNKINSWWDF